MDKKLTDNEIIKALEEILEIMLVMGDLQKSSTISKAIKLINRLQVRVEKLEKVEHFADKTIATLQAENKYLNETINNLTLKKDALFDKVDELKVEVTKLNAENMLTMSERNAFRNSFYEVSKQLKTTKSEAVKEFAERLKHKSDNRFDYSELVFEISEEDIDNLVKEMVGEDK